MKKLFLFHYPVNVILINIFLTILPCYFSFSFMFWQMNPGLWTEENRIGFIVCSVLCYFGRFIIRRLLYLASDRAIQERIAKDVYDHVLYKLDDFLDKR